MSQQWISRSVVEAPFLAPDGVGRLGRSVWLYLHLLRSANHRGLVMRTVERLHDELVVPKGTIEEWVRRLSDSRLIVIESPPPFLVIKLPFWSGHGDATSAKRDQLSGSEAPALEVPISSKQQPAAAAFYKAGEGGAGEGEALAAEVIRALDGADAGEVRDLIAEFPKPVVLKALIRVKSTPSAQIRKSKVALFRYLLTKFSQNPHAH